MDNNRVFDYTILKRLGEGSFGEVVLAKKNGEQFAIKQISKKQIIKVLLLSPRLINYMNPSSKKKFCSNSTNTAKNSPCSSKFMTLNPTMTEFTLSSSTAVGAPWKT